MDGISARAHAFQNGNGALVFFFRRNSSNRNESVFAFCPRLGGSIRPNGRIQRSGRGSVMRLKQFARPIGVDEGEIMAPAVKVESGNNAPWALPTEESDYVRAPRCWDSARLRVIVFGKPRVMNVLQR